MSNKIRYCKLCGQRIEVKTSKCTGCGKQYFHFQWRWKPVSILLICILSFTSLYYWDLAYENYDNWHLYKSKFEDSEFQKRVIESQVSSLKRENKFMEDQINKNTKAWLKTNEKAAFLDDHIAIVTENGSKYHRSDCQYVEDKTFYAYNTELAISYGYTPCSVCQK